MHACIHSCIPLFSFPFLLSCFWQLSSSKGFCKEQVLIFYLFIYFLVCFSWTGLQQYAIYRQLPLQPTLLSTNIVKSYLVQCSFFLRQMKKWKTPFVKFLSIYWPAWWKVHLEEGFKDQDLMKIIIFISKNIVIELAKYNLRWTAAHGILHHVNNYFTKIRQQCKSSVKSVK